MMVCSLKRRAVLRIFSRRSTIDAPIHVLARDGGLVPFEAQKYCS